MCLVVRFRLYSLHLKKLIILFPTTNAINFSQTDHCEDADHFTRTSFCYFSIYIRRSGKNSAVCFLKHISRTKQECGSNKLCRSWTIQFMCIICMFGVTTVFSLSILCFYLLVSYKNSFILLGIYERNLTFVLARSTEKWTCKKVK